MSDYDDEFEDGENIPPMTLPEKHDALKKAAPFLRECVKVFGVSPDHEITLRRAGRFEGYTTIRKAVNLAKRSTD